MTQRIILYFTLFLFLFSSCQLVDVLDKYPENQADADQAITNPNAAELALRGIYFYLPGGKSDVIYPTVSGSFKAGTMLRQDLVKVGNAVYFSERTLPVLSYSDGTEWDSDYEIIKNSILLEQALTKIDKSSFEGNRADEIIGEIAFLRALANFRLLVRYGEFWDENSEYGITLRTEVHTVANSPKARSSVKETYEHIMSNLETAIAHAPHFSSASAASKEAALALKAKVLFYAGRYDEALTAIEKVLPLVKFENNYADIFIKATTPDNKEILFQRVFGKEEIPSLYMRESAFGNSVNKNEGYWGPTKSYIDLVGDDPRAEAIFANVDSLDSRGKVGYNLTTVKKTLNSDNTMPVFFLRSDELQLMKAEALMRTNASIAAAYEPIRMLRTRAGAPVVVPATRAELEDAIFNEWLIEMSFENWHEWFLMLRFAGLKEANPDFSRLLAMNRMLREAYEKEVKAGKGEEYLERIKSRRIDAIPTSEINSNLESKQNPGY
ncbi:MAG: RagB/SusD family nutrient uptake outer membrane protein [Petrimonas sp.]|uniref:RagB/SusD family nutrient uptake outer membrane protein n=1 Tax=Petrimonas sp. TaxID=2023866 RepID=UPI000959666A|nr:RagB/SusD family nutrient uptake outer membrane protein [Petrimonas sp.]MEA5046610.1 RagB/SusD family nutrient uptake outer membrane protein [Petrimonas sp.]MEA5063566.1 RagB/SusD family nutrient uptake outer membrane protein [Petrimonas sp.]OJV35551.1 MAG: RagB/SusD family nutrient uptake outer membrane protein [Bacteroidia bacterium 43-41]